MLFRSSKNIPPTFNVWFSPDDHNESSFSIMPYGVLAHLPVIHLPSYSIAILRSSDHAPVGLILVSCGHCHSDKLLYHCGLPRGQRFVPLNVTISPSPPSSPHLVARWEDVRLASRPAFRANDMPTALPRDLARTNPDPKVPFRVSNAALRALRHTQEVLLHWSGPTPAPAEWASSQTPMTLVFRARYHLCFICIDIGMCQHAEDEEPWARVRFYNHHDVWRKKFVEDGARPHACREDHISQWEKGAKTFYAERVKGEHGKIYSLSVELLFAPFVLDYTGRVLELQHVTYTWRCK